MSAEPTLGSAIAWITGECDRFPILAAGIDTLTEWNDGPSGWRPADRWLRDRYPAVSGSVIAPNSLFGAMLVSGAGFLVQLRPRFGRDRTLVTETHPKVCYYALRGQRHEWRSRSMIRWLTAQLAPATCRFQAAHDFDACMSVLAALRGFRGDWTLDLHRLPANERKALAECGKAVRLVGAAHFWWPNDPKAP